MYLLSVLKTFYPRQYTGRKVPPTVGGKFSGFCPDNHGDEGNFLNLGIHLIPGFTPKRNLDASCIVLYGVEGSVGTNNKTKF